MRRMMAIVLVALALTAGCGDDDDEPNATTTTSTIAVLTTTSGVALSTSSTTSVASIVVDAAGVAQAWIQAIADGDDDRAVALTSPRSLEVFGGAEGFENEEIALAEGWGAWARAEQKTVSVIDLPGLDGVALVVLHGEVSQEGPPEESWAALAVVSTVNGYRVEPFLDLGTVEVTPDNGSAIAPDEAFTPVTPDGARALFVIDDGEAMTEDELANHEPLTPGLHALIVIVWNADSVMARSFTYTVNA